MATTEQQQKRWLAPNDTTGLIAPSSGHSPFVRVSTQSPYLLSSSFNAAYHPTGSSSASDRSSDPFGYASISRAPPPGPTSSPTKGKAAGPQSPTRSSTAPQPQSPGSLAGPSSSSSAAAPSASAGAPTGTAAAATVGAGAPLTSPSLEDRAQTLEEMYSAPENFLEIEVREPRTQGASISLSVPVCSPVLTTSVCAHQSLGARRTRTTRLCAGPTFPRSGSGIRPSGAGTRTLSSSATCSSASRPGSTFPSSPARSSRTGTLFLTLHRLMEQSADYRGASQLLGRRD